MRSVACYICGSTEAAPLAHLRGPDVYLSLLGMDLSGFERRIVCCTDCGLVFKDPTLDPDEVDRLYRTAYRDHLYRSRSAEQLFTQTMSIPPEQSENAQKLAWMARALDRHGGTVRFGRLLDVGCGVGVVLAMAQRMFPDWDKAGVEPGAEAAAVAAAKTGVPVIADSYRPGMFDRPFDVITLLHVLEHLPDPAALLSALSADLAPGGVVFIETPSIEDLGSRPIDDDRFMAPHLFFFSRHSIANLCHRAGFEVIESEIARTVRGHYDLRVLCRPMNDESRSPPLRRDALHAVAALASRWNAP